MKSTTERETIELWKDQFLFIYMFRPYPRSATSLFYVSKTVIPDHCFAGHLSL